MGGSSILRTNGLLGASNNLKHSWCACTRVKVMSSSINERCRSDASTFKQQFLPSTAILIVEENGPNYHPPCRSMTSLQKIFPTVLSRVVPPMLLGLASSFLRKLFYFFPPPLGCVLFFPSPGVRAEPGKSVFQKQTGDGRSNPKSYTLKSLHNILITNPCNILEYAEKKIRKNRK